MMMRRSRNPERGMICLLLSSGLLGLVALRASAFSPALAPPRASFALYMATWSDSKAVMDYQKFLATGKQEIELKSDGSSVIVRPTAGECPLADALLEMGMGDDLVLTPDQEMPATIGNSITEFPIYITLPPWEIAEFIKNLPQSYKDKNEDFVFFSGGLSYGNIEDVLKERGYARDSMTQVLISGMKIKTSKRVEDLTVNLGADSYGEPKLAGTCSACGKWNGAIARRLERSNVQCQTDFYRDWRRKMWERSVFDAIFTLCGSVREQPTTVADVANYYKEEVSDLVWDMSQLLRGWRAQTLLYGFEERMFEFAQARGAEQSCTLGGADPTVPVEKIYPFVWGNFVYLQSKLFVEYLQLAQAEYGQLYGVDLPVKSDDEYASKMRQGNLRADGVI